jgi:hypothetical protein
VGRHNWDVWLPFLVLVVVLVSGAALLLQNGAPLWVVLLAALITALVCAVPFGVAFLLRSLARLRRLPVWIAALVAVVLTAPLPLWGLHVATFSQSNLEFAAMVVLVEFVFARSGAEIARRIQVRRNGALTEA